MFDFLKRPGSNESRDNPFQDWPSLEGLPTEDILPDVFRQPVLDIHNGATIPNAGGVISPAIVIGVGMAGEIILRGWKKRIQESGAVTRDLRCYWLYHSEKNQPDLPAAVGRQRQINIRPDGGMKVDGARSSREAMQACFNQPSVYDKLKEYLVRDAQDLNRNFRVFIAASVREPIVGIVGDLLQLLSLLSNDRDLHLAVTLSCILTLDGSLETGGLSDAETFAVVREISRLTFKGIHVMPPAVGERTGILRKEALEYLFFVESPVQADGKQPVPFETGSAEISAETIYVLTHPKGDKIWSDLINCLTAGSTIQQVLQTPLVYAVKSAALYLPLALLQQYAVLRLTNAVLFGEKIDSGEGLVRGKTEFQDIESLAKGWLSAKPNQHLFFPWLVIARRSPRPLPPLSSGQAGAQALKQRLCSQLNIYLNSREGSLESACQAITWLWEMHSDILLQLNRAPAAKTGKAAQPEQALRDYLNEAQRILENTGRELEAWAAILDPAGARAQTAKSENTLNAPIQEKRPYNPFETDPAAGRSSNPFETTTEKLAIQTTNPFENQTRQRNPFENPAEHDTAPAEAQAAEEPFVLPDLTPKIRLAYKALVDAGNAPISRSVIQKTAGRDEIENLYREIIRPELSSDNCPSPYFERIRSRLGWWVTIDPVQGDLRIAGVALPHTWQPGHNQLQKSAFPVQQAGAFYIQVVDICTQEMRSLKRKFSDQQFIQAALEKKGFLSSAGENCIRYNPTQVANDRQLSSETAKSFGYLLYKPVETQQVINFREYAFDSLVRSQSTDVKWDESRVVALQIMTNLPAWRIEMLSRAHARYLSAMFRHLYEQEKNALEYERRARDEKNEEVLLSPSTCMLLADANMVDLFFRAYLARMVRPTLKSNGLQTDYEWAVVDVPIPDSQPPAVYPPLFLNVQDNSAAGLWEALEAFALKLPNRPRDEITPADPFHRDERQRYLSALLAAARDRMTGPEYQTWRKEVRNRVLPELYKAAKTNPLAGDLACLIRLELNSFV